MRSHCKLLRQECEHERAEYNSFQRHALSQDHHVFEDIERGGCGMV